jgi:uncharacterized protein (DUF427 family)
MKAMVGEHVVADSDDVVECKGYQYFPQSSVHMEWLQKTDRTVSDKECPHGVQFYDVLIEGVRHSRAAWQYEWPRPAMRQTAGRFGFWEDVRVE